MPYADRARRRAYDAAYKRRQRAEGLTKKRVDMRLTPAALEITNVTHGLFKEVVEEAQNADESSLRLETKLRIKLQAVEIGLRLIEVTNHEQRIAALKEQSK
jgi:hypothetical protein